MSERIPAAATAAATRRAVAALRNGEIVVVPTDTVYGAVVDAFNRSALERLRRAKKRTRRLPFSVVLRSPRQVTGLVSDIPEAADRLMSSYWPGPLTLVLPVSDGLGWDLGDTLGTVGLRMPTSDLLLSVIAEVGPLACTAANAAGEPAPIDVDKAEEQLGEMVGLYIDGGPCDGTVSTVVDVTGDAVRVLREGAISAEHVHLVADGQVPWGSRPGETGEVPEERGDVATPDQPVTMPDQPLPTPDDRPRGDQA
jgi:L-threonylcarbamoyladenylate synthase